MINRVFRDKKNVTVVESVMVWYFMGFYMIYRKLHGRLEVQNFFSLVEKIFHSFAITRREISYLHVIIYPLFRGHMTQYDFSFGS